MQRTLRFAGNEYELKSVNAKSDGELLDVDHHLNPVILKKYREVIRRGISPSTEPY